MTVLLDTHFLIWVLVDSPRLGEFPWLDDYRPWTVSPVSLLELAFLSEVALLEITSAEFYDILRADPRFVFDEPALAALIAHALPLAWTRDPFDRLLAAHSASRRLPFCSLDRRVRTHHRFLPREMKPQ